MPKAPDPAPAQLVGSWRLLSVRSVFSDTKEHIEPYGPNPAGWMVLEPGGRIMFLFMKPDRQPPANDADRAVLFDEMIAYTGLVRSDGPGRFVTTVDLVWKPAASREVLRFYTLEGDRLMIRSPDHTLPQFKERLMVTKLVWQREQSTVVTHP